MDQVKKVVVIREGRVALRDHLLGSDKKWLNNCLAEIVFVPS